MATSKSATPATVVEKNTKKVITAEERQANCDAFVKYIGSRNLEDHTITVEQLSRIWSGSY